MRNIARAQKNTLCVLIGREYLRIQVICALQRRFICILLRNQATTANKTTENTAHKRDKQSIISQQTASPKKKHDPTHMTRARVAKRAHQNTNTKHLSMPNRQHTSCATLTRTMNKHMNTHMMQTHARTHILLSSLTPFNRNTRKTSHIRTLYTICVGIYLST